MGLMEYDGVATIWRWVIFLISGYFGSLITPWNFFCGGYTIISSCPHCDVRVTLVDTTGDCD
ncbi:uncharacterized protein BDW47DRAFT_15338 [Aspergillus candidus]|uniref:Uncharacterized protein n=1 Tax=Aspergillus candidus TaxID=41067 RepID=A0A2I2FFE6_ASPCN|nr:hypothetical protein BDW47DRAFT_15338 [Aspergillus candidus]PLB39362.1 hypothetical protein BDW47DRAFT_15338 [Aspergillus candidus]